MMSIVVMMMKIMVIIFIIITKADPSISISVAMETVTRGIDKAFAQAIARQ